MANPIKTKHLDRRTADRYVKQGVLNKADYQKHLNALPDSSEDLVQVDYDSFDPIPVVEEENSAAE